MLWITILDTYCHSEISLQYEHKNPRPPLLISALSSYFIPIPRIQSPYIFFGGHRNVIGSPWLWHELYHHVSSENEIIFWNEADQVRTYFHFLDFQFHLNVGFGALKKTLLSILMNSDEVCCFFSWDKQCPSHGWKRNKNRNFKIVLLDCAAGPRRPRYSRLISNGFKGVCHGNLLFIAFPRMAACIHFWEKSIHPLCHSKSISQHFASQTGAQFSQKPRASAITGYEPGWVWPSNSCHFDSQCSVGKEAGAVCIHN